MKLDPTFCCRTMRSNATHWRDPIEQDGSARSVAVIDRDLSFPTVDKFGLSQPGHHETIAIRFCPWCGKDLIRNARIVAERDRIIHEILKISPGFDEAALRVLEAAELRNILQDVVLGRLSDHAHPKAP